MAAVGVASGAILVAKPATGDFLIKPYFWVLIAIGVSISRPICADAARPEP